MSAMTPEDKHIHEIVEKETKYLKEEIASLKENQRLLTNALRANSRAIELFSSIGSDVFKPV